MFKRGITILLGSLYQLFHFHMIVEMWYKVLLSSRLESDSSKLKAGINLKSFTVWATKPLPICS